MNIRKPVDYTEMYRDIDNIIASDLPQVKLYYEIGRTICARTEKGTAVAVSEYVTANYPEQKGFSPRNTRRMREFAAVYADDIKAQMLALTLGWTQNIAIFEAELTTEQRIWYMELCAEKGLSSTELAREIENDAYSAAHESKAEAESVPNSTNRANNISLPYNTPAVLIGQHQSPRTTAQYCRLLIHRRI